MKLTVTERAAFRRLAKARRDRLIRVADAGRDKAIEGLETVLNTWFKYNIFPFLSTEMLG